MVAAHAFASDGQARSFRAVLSGLRGIGYSPGLVREEYAFRDWFVGEEATRFAPAAAFGQSPPSYETACVAVLLSNGRSGADLVREYRALGAPLAFEVREADIVEWKVASDPSTEDRREIIDIDRVGEVFGERSSAWSPKSILRAKNIYTYTPDLRPRQLDFFDLGLIPALEKHIHQKLDPLLQEALAAAVTSYEARTGRPPDPEQLFKLAFWMLAGKICHDRGVAQFAALDKQGAADPVLHSVAEYYDEDIPRLLDRGTRQVVYDGIWTALDFRNVSVEILAHIWSSTFVTHDIRQSLGIHCTPRSLARYIVDHLPFEDIPEEERFVLEPCCGSGTFLVAAMQRLKDLMPEGQTDRERHTYFKKMLAGVDQEPFGFEISRLSLMLADFPNPDGWRLEKADIFRWAGFSGAIKQARVVLCNPPHEDFDDEERSHYKLSSVHKPVEILNRVLAALRPDGMLGFVLPRAFLDGRGYRELRGVLAERFATIELVSLPDKVFEHADQETTLLLASGNAQGCGRTRLRHKKVTQDFYEQFTRTGRATREDEASVTPDMARSSMAVPDLNTVWEALEGHGTLDDIAEIHRGIEWGMPLTEKRDGRRKETGNRQQLVRPSPRAGFQKGIPPDARDAAAFQPAATAYLDVRKKTQRGKAYEHLWQQPKVFVNAHTRSRGCWRIAAFSDPDGLVCYQNYTGVWPQDTAHLDIVAAVLNGPVANAFVATHEGKRDVKKCTLQHIPVPAFSSETVHLVDKLVALYLIAVSPAETRNGPDVASADNILRQIDLVILRAYGLPSELEIKVLEYFEGSARTVPFDFMGYEAADLDAVITLDEFTAAFDEWGSTNSRREQLIEEEVSGRISPHGSIELDRLQQVAQWRQRFLAALPVRQMAILAEGFRAPQD